MNASVPFDLWHSLSGAHNDLDMNAIDQLHLVAVATVFAGGAGIRATVPLFILSFANLAFPDHVPLQDSSKWLGHWYICVGLAVLLIVEILADLIPWVDHALHVILSWVYPIVGAFVAYAPAYKGGLLTHVPMAAGGAVLAFSAHAGKTAVRAANSAHSGGLGNCAQSVGGTVGLVIVCIVAFLVTLLSILLAGLVIAGCIYSVTKIREVARDGTRMRRTVVPVVAAVRWRRAARRNQSAADPLTSSQSLQPVQVAERQASLEEGVQSFQSEEPAGTANPSSSSAQDSSAQSLDKRMAELSRNLTDQENDEAMSMPISKMRVEIGEGYEHLSAISFWEDPRGQKKEALKEFLGRKKQEVQSIHDRHSSGTKLDPKVAEKWHDEFKREMEKILGTKRS